MNKHGIHFVIDERVKSFDTEKTRQLIDIIKQQHFGPYEEMCIDLEANNMLLFDEAIIVKLMTKNKYWYVQVASDVDNKHLMGKINLTFRSGKEGNRVRITLNHEATAKKETLDQLVALIKQISQLLTNVRWGFANSIGFKHYTFYEKYKLENLFGCFGHHIRWIHILGKMEYERFSISKEDLLQAPAFEVEELNNDTIFIMSYENPFSWEDEDTVAKIKTLNDYLLSKGESVQW